MIGKLIRQFTGKSLRSQQAEQVMAKYREDTEKAKRQIRRNAAISEELVKQLAKDLTCH